MLGFFTDVENSDSREQYLINAHGTMHTGIPFAILKDGKWIESEMGWFGMARNEKI
jgi:hypothetical protein